MLRKREITDNSGNIHEVWVGAELGDKFRCKKTTIGLCDSGNINILFEAERLIEGKVYPVTYIGDWDFIRVPRITDEDGCSTWLNTNLFTPLKKR